MRQDAKESPSLVGVVEGVSGRNSARSVCIGGVYLEECYRV